MVLERLGEIRALTPGILRIAELLNLTFSFDFGVHSFCNVRRVVADVAELGRLDVALCLVSERL